MSDLTVLNVKIDRKLKKQAQATAKALGLPVSALVSASLRDVVRRRSITFGVEPQLRPEIEAELLKLSENARKGIDISPAFDNVDESIEWLEREVEKESKR